ncbi:alpha-amylase family glycosyl hydrolase [Actinoplanes sp. NPDC051851]|uniref:alpha-amylase family glycosyl hydrolase n=1 Tax=Actinoplanes sp. NPDC051851 TaxID=3154753 RepID=UPI00343C17CB
MGGWVEHAVWWHVYPLGFGGRLDRLAGWLDYAVELGASGLQLGPVFASETHGYDTLDHFAIDPRLGTDEDFDKLVAACRERGLHLLLDGVFNHVGRGFRAPETWFRREASGEKAVFEGHHGLVALNHDEPEVVAYVARVMNHWLDRGASGWRLDAAYAVPARFWREVLPQTRPRHPGAWFAGEVIHGDYTGYLRESGLDSITQYELWKAIWSSLNDRNLFELAWALDRHNAVLGAGLPLTFVGNHDVTRIATRLDDERHLGHALALLFTVGGSPSVYYGDEQAFRGLKEERAGGDDAIRPAFPDRPDELAPYGWPTYRLHQRLIGLRRRHAWLSRATTTPLHLTNTALALRSSSGDDRIVTLLNVGDTAVTFPIDAGGLSVLEADAPGDGRSPGTVPAHGWSVLGESGNRSVR